MICFSPLQEKPGLILSLTKAEEEMKLETNSICSSARNSRCEQDTLPQSATGSSPRCCRAVEKCSFTPRHHSKPVQSVDLWRIYAVCLYCVVDNPLRDDRMGQRAAPGFVRVSTSCVCSSLCLCADVCRHARRSVCSDTAVGTLL